MIEVTVDQLVWLTVMAGSVMYWVVGGFYTDRPAFSFNVF
jgi:hypothetical protein